MCWAAVDDDGCDPSPDWPPSGVAFAGLVRPSLSAPARLQLPRHPMGGDRLAVDLELPGAVAFQRARPQVVRPRPIDLRLEPFCERRHRPTSPAPGVPERCTAPVDPIPLHRYIRSREKQLAPSRTFRGAPARIRTRDPLLRRQPLYPTELQGQVRHNGTLRGFPAHHGAVRHPGSGSPSRLG